MIKRGQFQISFGMIFSIIIIIATLAAGIYAIRSFLSFNECNQMANFFVDFQSKTNKVWNSDSANDIFKGRLPGEVQEVCLGDKNFVLEGGQFVEEQEYVKKVYIQPDKNVFMYPLSCDSTTSQAKIKNLAIKGFFCVPVVDGEVQIKLVKGNFDALARAIQ